AAVHSVCSARLLARHDLVPRDRYGDWQGLLVGVGLQPDDRLVLSEHRSGDHPDLAELVGPCAGVTFKREPWSLVELGSLRDRVDDIVREPARFSTKAFGEVLLREVP